MTDAEQRRVNNRAQFAALTAAYHALSADQRALVKAEFAARRIHSPGISWGKFLAVALPLLPAETSAA